MQPELGDSKCEPCRGGASAMNLQDAEKLRDELGGEWRLIDGHHIEKTFRFKNFRHALDFTVRAGEIAEAEGHHPEITLGWGQAHVRIWTHKIDGLTRADFVLAAKIDRTA